MILIDANALVVLMVGLVDKELLKNHRRTSIYEEQDYMDMLDVIGSLDRLLVLPNVWTETDNLLNDFGGNYKYPYLNQLVSMFKLTTEEYIASDTAPLSNGFMDLGLTDSILLERAKTCEFLITGDSELSMYARAYGIEVYDVVERRNVRFN